mgnify:FL=1
MTERHPTLPDVLAEILEQFSPAVAPITEVRYPDHRDGRSADRYPNAPDYDVAGRPLKEGT